MSSKSPSGCEELFSRLDINYATDLIGKIAVTIVVLGAAGWVILLLMCAYAKGRERRA